MAPLIRFACTLALLGLFAGLPFMAGVDRPRATLTSSWPR